MNPLAIALQGMGFEVAQIALQGFVAVTEQPIVVARRKRAVQVNEDDELILLLM